MDTGTRCMEQADEITRLKYDLEAARNCLLSERKKISWQQEHIEHLEQERTEQLEQTAEAGVLRTFRELLGYIECGEGSAVTIGQDDATGTWYIRRDGKRLAYADTFSGVIVAAAGE